MLVLHYRAYNKESKGKTSNYSIHFLILIFFSSRHRIVLKANIHDNDGQTGELKVK